MCRKVKTHESNLVIPDVLLVVLNPYILQVFQSLNINVVQHLLSEFAVAERVEPEFRDFLGEFGTALEDGLLELYFLNVCECAKRGERRGQRLKGRMHAVKEEKLGRFERRARDERGIVHQGAL